MLNSRVERFKLDLTKLYRKHGLCLISSNDGGYEFGALMVVPHSFRYEKETIEADDHPDLIPKPNLEDDL